MDPRLGKQLAGSSQTGPKTNSVALPTAMNVMRPSMLCLLLTVSCYGLDRDPAWVKDFVSKLECGMTLTEIQGLTDREVKPAQSQTSLDLGTHLVNSKWAEVWLDLEGGQLTSVTSGRIDGLTSIRLTPKKNICSGKLTFILSLEWIEPLQGADVYWDGHLVEADASSGLIFPVSAGAHELRVVKEGYEPIVKHLRFEVTDPGRRDVTLTSQDLRPANQAGS